MPLVRVVLLASVFTVFAGCSDVVVSNHARDHQRVPCLGPKPEFELRPGKKCNGLCPERLDPATARMKRRRTYSRVGLRA